MLSGQLAQPATALHFKPYTATTSNTHTNNTAIATTIGTNLRDDSYITAYDQQLSNTSTSLLPHTCCSPTSKQQMTKQLPASTATAITTTNANLAPTVISPSNSTTNTAATSPSTTTGSDSLSASAAGSCTALLKGNNQSPIKKQQQQTGSLKPQQSGTAATNGNCNDTNGRSAALERAYVHDVYENCVEPTGPVRPRVAQFLSNLDVGSVVCDVGCGSGRYLTNCNPAICTIGVDRCYRLSKVAKEKGGEVAICDNLELPFRDECFDAVLSLAVIHHFATTERRVSALRELARILRIGGRVIITVWALEQRHRRFESQDVLIPWQPPKNRNYSYSDEEDDDDFLPPYHAYTEDSTNSSRSAGDGDSSSLSSSSPGESCYSFVRRAIQKLAGGRRHAWFLDSWTSKDTKNDSSLDYEDAKDLPIELRRLEDFEDFTDPPLSAGLKSRSLGCILNPPPRQIVRSRSSVPSLGGPATLLLHNNDKPQQLQGSQYLSAYDSHGSAISMTHSTHSNGPSPTHASISSANSTLARRPKLIKQKQSLCEEDNQASDQSFQMVSTFNSSNNSVSNSLYSRSGCYHNVISYPQHYPHHAHQLHQQHSAGSLTSRHAAQTSTFLRKQSSLNEELMAANRIREKERVRKRIQKQMSLNEAFLCRSAIFSKRLQVIREGVTTKIKSSTGSLERVTKNSLTRIIQNFKPPPGNAESTMPATANNQATQSQNHCQQHKTHYNHQHHHHHHHHHQQQQKQSVGYQTHLRQLLHLPAPMGPVTYCNSVDCASTACFCSSYHCSNSAGILENNNESAEEKARRHSRESGSDSSKDGSLQSDTSIESEDSFASVIYIPKPEQHQQQLNYQQQHQNSNSSSSNSSSSNGGNCQKCSAFGSMQQANCKITSHQQNHNACGQQRIPSVPTSPLIMPCPPTPAHSPAAAQAAVTSPPQTMAAVTAAMAILTPPCKANSAEDVSATVGQQKTSNDNTKSRFNFDEAHLKQHATNEQKQKVVHQEQKHQQLAPQETKKTASSSTNLTKSPPMPKITRQTIKELPPIPKFRKQQSLQLQRQHFPIVRRASGSSGGMPGIVPKLLSLELFNPATDDLDSDSSEPSSPDSIDSVISAPRSAAVTTAQSVEVEDEKDIRLCGSDETDFIKTNQQQYHNGELQINAASTHDIILNDDSSNILPTAQNQLEKAAAKQQTEDCAEFAEKLSAQLLREIEDKSNRANCRSLDSIGDIGEYLDESSHKKRNGELRDLNSLREELRERRLMLANLSTQPSLQQSPASSSTSSLSSQTRSFTIHEEDEDDDEEENERSYTLQLYENCKISKFNYKRNRNYNLNPETAYLLQDDGDSSVRDEDDDEFDDIEHDVILEEDEEAVAAEALEDSVNAQQGNTYANRYEQNETGANSDKCNGVTGNGGTVNFSKLKSKTNASDSNKKTEEQANQGQSTESWEHSNSSTASLDSPSQGGATTHHRYYHVFREGELDALINHHVASLHIVSSYYERASWCVVAEKVQVWTI